MKPLGYWLVHLHDLIETRFHRALEADGLTRRHWQVLNTIATEPGTLTEVEQALAHFHDDVRPLVEDFAGRGWLTGECELTEAGRRAHDRIAAQVHAQRARLLDGISDDEYVELIRMLERIAENAAAPV
ncbi:MarR family transcriptional regulator [Saccharothrix sp. S26]|uniref:MarR family winged helix-turn-helix transcriptional regulator n=1 Tax=Saccharothrix sp. S26 TaxID=2907215 RepID=UPI001F4324E0|nr:MarR family transcriptional regulator [Saccharothrix sp. S26]MCE6997322.1 MarR family transcriptional regulator [Saccharothrix sp. S26]